MKNLERELKAVAAAPKGAASAEDVRSCLVLFVCRLLACLCVC